jgi:hypothetical protein
MCTFSTPVIWKSNTEPKTKFIAWLVMHNRVLTADNLIKSDRPYDPIYPLYFCMNETTPHMLIECNYSDDVWNFIAESFGLLPFQILSVAGGPYRWVHKVQGHSSKKERKKNVGSHVHVLVVHLEGKKRKDLRKQRSLCPKTDCFNQGSHSVVPDGVDIHVRLIFK